jgi:transposase
VHLVCDGRGHLLAVYVTAGQAHDSTGVEPVLRRVSLRRRRGRRRWPRWLGGDKGYSYPGVRQRLRRRGMTEVIPTRSNQPRQRGFRRGLYRRRNWVERVVGWYKEYRRLATRFEKLAVHYLALWMVAMIERLLRKTIPGK